MDGLAMDGHEVVENMFFGGAVQGKGGEVARLLMH